MRIRNGLCCIIGTLALLVGTGCLQPRREVTSGYVGCAPRMIELSEETDYAWAATCQGRRFRCSSMGSTVACTPELAPPTKDMMASPTPPEMSSGVIVTTAIPEACAAAAEYAKRAAAQTSDAARDGLKRIAVRKAAECTAAGGTVPPIPPPGN